MYKTAVRVLLVVLCAASVAGSQTVWSKYPGNPVFGAGAPGAWDRNGAGIVSVIHDQGIYKAWYAGLDDTAGRIGYATSADGLTWNRHQTPVLDLGNPGEWDDAQADHACVLLIGGVYRMWYSGEDGGNSRIGYATSADGIVWQKYPGNPVLDLGAPGSWEESEVFHPSVLFDGQTYHIWYNGYGMGAQRTGHATSPDGVAWTRYPGNPVLALGSPDSFDDYMLALMAVLQQGGSYHLWYTAGDGTDEDAKYFRIGYATSLDGADWTKYGANPILDIGPAGTWDSLGVATSCVLFDSVAGIFKMWYGGLDGAGIGTGYATSDPATHADGTSGTLLPDRPILHQCYPNPFNPTTTVRYQLPAISRVRIAVYDVLGREVAVLVNEKQGPGSYEARFDASDLSSGAYLYRMAVESFVQSGKMILAK